MHARKKIEIIVEAVRAEAVTLLLDRMGATGWTILPVLAGRGHQGIRRAGDPGGVDDNVLCCALPRPRWLRVCWQPRVNCSAQGPRL